jgi:uncharacterized membrane protein
MKSNLQSLPYLNKDYSDLGNDLLAVRSLHLIPPHKRQSFILQAPFEEVNSKYIFLFLVLLQVLDALLTYRGLSIFGLEIEANPLIRILIERLGSFFGLLLVKSIAVLAVFYLWSLRERVLWIPVATKFLSAYYVFFAILPWTYLFIHVC